MPLTPPLSRREREQRKRGPAGAGLGVGEDFVALGEGSAGAVLAGHSYGGAFEQQRTEG